MEIKRYLNGEPISETVLGKLEMVTPELEAAVREARRRAELTVFEKENNEQRSING